MFKKIVGLGFSSKGKNAKDVKKYIGGLVESGAGEFFVGYNPSYWSDKFGFEVSPNGRFAEHEQVTDLETLEAIVTEVHSHKLEIFINLNAWYYTPETMPFIEKMVSEFIKLGIDGIICGNISILEYLSSIDYKGKINISTIMAVYNKEAIRFFIENYKINKIILSREVTLKEIEEISKEFPKMNFEVFGEGDFCRYNNGLCFAEHKYGAKDICTVVVNDLVIKKKFRADFKEFILDETLINSDKIKMLDDKYLDDFEQLSEIIMELELGFLVIDDDYIGNIFILIKKISKRVDLYFDALKTLESSHNKKILEFFKNLKNLQKEYYINLSKENKELIGNLINELDNSFRSYMKFHFSKLEKVGGKAKLKALELGSFYAKGDNLNLYSYLFFDEIENVDTVKFPTRGRNYSEKIKLIDEVIKSGKIRDDLLDRGISLERVHYDLTYLFGDKLWFRKMINKK